MMFIETIKLLTKIWMCNEYIIYSSIVKKKIQVGGEEGLEGGCE